MQGWLYFIFEFEHGTLRCVLFCYLTSITDERTMYFELLQQDITAVDVVNELRCLFPNSPQIFLPGENSIVGEAARAQSC